MIPQCDKCSGRTNSILLACLSQGASKFILEGSSDGLLWLAALANHGEKLAGQVQTFLYHVARSEKNLAGWLICWVAVAGNSCKPSSETAFVFKVYIIRSQSGTQGGRSTCRMKADLAATLSR